MNYISEIAYFRTEKGYSMLNSSTDTGHIVLEFSVNRL